MSGVLAGQRVAGQHRPEARRGGQELDLVTGRQADAADPLPPDVVGDGRAVYYIDVQAGTLAVHDEIPRAAVVRDLKISEHPHEAVRDWPDVHAGIGDVTCVQELRVNGHG
jgi:hypothetical protein